MFPPPDFQRCPMTRGILKQSPMTVTSKINVLLLFIVLPSIYVFIFEIKSRVFSRVVLRQRVGEVNFPLFMQRTTE